MNTIRKSIIIGLTVIGLAGSAQAVHAVDAQGHGAKHEQMQAKWGERAAKREQKLHDALKLTPSQRGAWTTYTAALKRPARAERGECEARGAWKTMPAPQRMEKRLELAKQRLAMMETRLAATTAFYGVLTPEQKKAFDQTAMHHGGHGMRRSMHS